MDRVEFVREALASHFDTVAAERGRIGWSDQWGDTGAAYDVADLALGAFEVDPAAFLRAVADDIEALLAVDGTQTIYEEAA